MESDPGAIRYATVRLDDGVTFVHVAFFDGEDNPLTASPAFAEFLSGIADRCVDGPAPVNGTVIGSYHVSTD